MRTVARRAKILRLCRFRATRHEVRAAQKAGAPIMPLRYGAAARGGKR